MGILFSFKKCCRGVDALCLFWNERFSSFHTCLCVCVYRSEGRKEAVRLSDGSLTWLDGAVLFLFFSDVHRNFQVADAQALDTTSPASQILTKQKNKQCGRCYHVGRAGTGEACRARGATSPSSLSTVKTKQGDLVSVELEQSGRDRRPFVTSAPEVSWLFCTINVNKEKKGGNCKDIVQDLARKFVWFDKRPCVVALQQTNNWTEMETDEMKIKEFALQETNNWACKWSHVASSWSPVTKQKTNKTKQNKTK